MRLLPVGEHGLLVEVGSVAEASALYVAVRAAAREDAAVRCTDVVPGARTVLFDGVEDVPRLRTWLGSLPRDAGAGAAAGGGRRLDPAVEVPTVYDGADLDDVARCWGMTRAEAIATHTGTAFVVAFCGFSPGFAYCTGLPPALSIPRLASPRPRVPAGAVAVAGEFTGVYPTASPGGWRLLGRTVLRLWDPSASHPATLSPGTAVRFVAVEE